MNTTANPAEKPAHLSRRILAKEGIECSILALAPGEQISCAEAFPHQEHVLFVLEGGLIATLGDVTLLATKDDAVHIPAGRAHTITGDPAKWSRLLRIDLTPREIPAPPLFRFPGE